MSKRYHIYKKDVQNYRVLDTMTGEFVVDSARFITAFDVDFLVDEEKYMEAEYKSFANSGDPKDYFACVACDRFTLGVQLVLPTVVKFNPFRSMSFFEEGSIRSLSGARVVTMMGNDLKALLN